MTDQRSTRRATTYKPEHTELAFRLATLDASEEMMARFLEVPVYAIYVWVETVPEFAAAVEQGRTTAALTPQRPSRNRYPAYTWGLQFCARTKQPELAAALRAKMQQMKAIGPEAMAGFNDVLWADVMEMQPGRKIPRRV
jgi:hypothetical protein